MNLELLLSIYAFVFGALWGSFLNVVVHRLPRGMSLSKPRSHCPECQRMIRWYENVPIFSYLALRGRCRGCKTRISPRYMFVELLTATLSLLVFSKVADGRLHEAEWGVALPYLFYFYFICAAIAIAFIDLEWALIPDIIVLPTAIVGLAAAIVVPKDGVWTSFAPQVTWVDSVVGLCVGAGVVLIIFWSYRAVTGRIGMGGGDVTMLAMIGAFLGWRSLLFVFFFASIQGLIGAMCLAAWEKSKGQTSALLLRGASNPEFWNDREAGTSKPLSEWKTAQTSDDPTSAPDMTNGGADRSTLSGADSGNTRNSDGDAAAGGDDQTGLGSTDEPQTPEAVPTATGDEVDETPFGQTGIPFGPFLALAAVEYFFIGHPVMQWLLLTDALPTP